MRAEPERFSRAARREMLAEPNGGARCPHRAERHRSPNQPDEDIGLHLNSIVPAESSEHGATEVADIIGLKVQAAVNDKDRAAGDWHDIESLIRAAREQGTTLDWGLIDEYLRIFNLGARLADLKRTYETHREVGDT